VMETVAMVDAVLAGLCGLNPRWCGSLAGWCAEPSTWSRSRTLTIRSRIGIGS